MKPSEEHHDLDVILDSIADGVFTVDSEWQITSFNRAAERITGVKRQDALGRRCCEVFRASICEGACALKHTLATGQPLVNKVVYILNAQGQKVPISVSTAILKDAGGTVIGGVETFRDLRLVEELRKELESTYTFANIVARSPAMRRIFDLLPEIAASDSTVLIEGPSGTGKELFAQAIHNLSPRAKKRFVAINCGALPDTLLESELFGYKAGAFTDAKQDKPGRFALADGGTIFLDEIGDISPAMQARLLRVLQERVFEPLGSVQPVPANVRVVAATNRNLAKLVGKGTFREDLFYRINVVRLELPALRDRREDIPLLIEHFVAKFNRLQGKDVAGLALGRLKELHLLELTIPDKPNSRNQRYRITDKGRQVLGVVK
jgi:PAS domain S-box-containing protein